MIENATAPPANATAPTAASNSGRRRRLGSACVLQRLRQVGDHLLGRGEFGGDGLLSGGQVPGAPCPPTVAIADPSRRRLSGVHTQTQRSPGDVHGPHRGVPQAAGQPFPGVNRASVFELIAHLSAAWTERTFKPAIIGNSAVPVGRHRWSGGCRVGRRGADGTLACRDEPHSDSHRDAAHQPRRHQDRTCSETTPPRRSPTSSDWRRAPRTTASRTRRAAPRGRSTTAPCSTA